MDLSAQKIKLIDEHYSRPPGKPGTLLAICVALSLAGPPLFSWANSRQQIQNKRTTRPAQKKLSQQLIEHLDLDPKKYRPSSSVINPQLIDHSVLEEIQQIEQVLVLAAAEPAQARTLSTQNDSPKVSQQYAPYPKAEPLRRQSKRQTRGLWQTKKSVSQKKLYARYGKGSPPLPQVTPKRVYKEIHTASTLRIDRHLKSYRSKAMLHAPNTPPLDNDFPTIDEYAFQAAGRGIAENLTIEDRPISDHITAEASHTDQTMTTDLRHIIDNKNSALATQIPVDIEADQLEHNGLTNTIHASGKVHITQGPAITLKAEKAIFDINSQDIEAPGQVDVTYDQHQFSTKGVRLNLSQKMGTLGHTSADLSGPGGKATAEKIDIHSQEKFTLHNASFTNCDCEDPPWHIVSDHIDIDREANSVVAKNTKLYLGDVPVLYTPFWRHPLEPVRKSGMLMPVLRISSAAGVEGDFPYYWNIAANRDATLTFHPTTKRGVMGKAQFRYLEPHFDGHFEIHAIQDTQENTLRGIALWDHNQELGPWQLRAHLKGSKSRDYINDFSQNLIESSDRRLDSSLTLRRLWGKPDGFSELRAGVLWHQDLTEQNDQETIQQLPYIFWTNSRPGWIDNSRLYNAVQFDNFYQLNGDSTQRIDIAPTLSYQRPTYFGRLHLSGRLRETAYLIHGNPSKRGNSDDDTLHREASMFQIRMDGKLQKRYEGRDKTDTPFKHTIEPTIQYVVNAASNQGPLPNYDASLLDLSTRNLFSDNLYQGVDRISTGHWISYGLTSRWISLNNDENQEWLTFTIGQRWAPSGHQEYQNDHSLSDIVSSVDLRPSNTWKISSASRFDPHRGVLRTLDSTATLYRNRKKREPGSEDDYLQVGYHIRRPEASTEITKDALLRTSWHVADNWRWEQRLDYSFEDNDMKSWRADVTYDHDCWSIKLSGGRNLSAKTDQHGGSWIGLYISLRGLGGYGFSS
ncbi:LPS-assembly protein LptD [Magnetococcales bacterium HHB-1]